MHLFLLLLDMRIISRPDVINAMTTMNTTTMVSIVGRASEVSNRDLVQPQKFFKKFKTRSNFPRQTPTPTPTPTPTYPGLIIQKQILLFEKKLLQSQIMHRYTRRYLKKQPKLVVMWPLIGQKAFTKIAQTKVATKKFTKLILHL